MPEQRTTRDKCRVCGKHCPEYTEIRENGEWYPSEDTPDNLKFGFCSSGCWETHLANIFGRCKKRQTERESRNSGQISRQDIPLLRVVKDDDQDDEDRNPGHRDGREPVKKGYKHHRR